MATADSISYWLADTWPLLAVYATDGLSDADRIGRALAGLTDETAHQIIKDACWRDDATWQEDREPIDDVAGKSLDVQISALADAIRARSREAGSYVGHGWALTIEGLAGGVKVKEASF